MKRKIFICDVEADYSYRLMEAVNGMISSPFEVRAFTSSDILESCLENEVPDILLISPAFLTDQIEKRGIGDIFILTEGKDRKYAENHHVVYKYQKAEDVIREIIRQYEQDHAGTDTMNFGRQAEVIGVYSPLHRIGKTTFALAIGQELGRDRKVLYLNLESCSGFPALLNRECDVDLSDLLYYARQDASLLALKLPAVTQTIHTLDYVPPARITSDLMEITSEEWHYLLSQIEGSGAYDTIIIDFGEGVQGLLTLLARCDKIYMPVAGDFISQGKICQYEEMLDALDYPEILDKTEKVALPVSEKVGEDSLYIGEFLWGPLTGFARSLLAGNGRS